MAHILKGTPRNFEISKNFPIAVGEKQRIRDGSGKVVEISQIVDVWTEANGRRFYTADVVAVAA